MPTEELMLYRDYSRQQIHDLFEPETPFTPQAGSWGLHGIVRLARRPGDFVLIVTFGQSQGEHTFDEGISTEGILRWQSQPRQGLADKTVRELIAHDEDRNAVYLFLRTAPRHHGVPSDYTMAAAAMADPARGLSQNGPNAGARRGCPGGVNSSPCR
jgi:hypothetical protein